MVDMDIKAIEVLSATILKAFREMTNDISCKATKRGIVKQVLDNDNYIVTIQGTDYTVPSAIEQKFLTHQTVLVVFIQGNLNDGHIIGKARN